jgi:hypothetical protein
LEAPVSKQERWSCEDPIPSIPNNQNVPHKPNHYQKLVVMSRVSTHSCEIEKEKEYREDDV